MLGNTARIYITTMAGFVLRVSTSSVCTCWSSVSVPITGYGNSQRSDQHRCIKALDTIDTGNAFTFGNGQTNVLRSLITISSSDLPWSMPWELWGLGLSCTEASSPMSSTPFMLSGRRPQRPRRGTLITCWTLRLWEKRWKFWLYVSQIWWNTQKKFIYFGFEFENLMAPNHKIIFHYIPYIFLTSS